jgi:hypothetical protein
MRQWFMQFPSVLSAFLTSALLLMTMDVSGLAYAEVHDLRAGQWSGGAGLGFLGNTPDGILEFGLQGHADHFVTPRFSVGPLAQYGGGGNDIMFGLSIQAKHWWDIPGSRNLAKLVLQGGVGVIQAGINDKDSDIANTYTSFWIPVGIGLDYILTKQLALTADFLVNFTSLGQTVRLAGREVDLHTSIMPGFYTGVRF